MKIKMQDIDELILKGVDVTYMPLDILEKLDNRCMELEKELKNKLFKPSKLALAYKNLKILTSHPEIYEKLYQIDGEKYCNFSTIF